jgi:hypothetical protein
MKLKRKRKKRQHVFLEDDASSVQVVNVEQVLV